MLRNILIVKDNYSEFIRAACWDELQKEGDQTLLKAEKQDLQNRIKEIDHELKKEFVNKDKIHDCLTTWHDVYKGTRSETQDRFNITWITDKVLPELKKLGYKGNPGDILDIFKDWPD